MPIMRISLMVKWLPSVAAAVVAAYFALVAAAWCWEGAYNVLQGERPAYGFSAVLLVAGALPAFAAGVYCIAMKRSGQSGRSSLGLGSLIAIVTSVFVLFFRAAAAAPF